MDGERRFEITDSGGRGTEPFRFYLVGAPDTGKEQLAKSIADLVPVSVFREAFLENTTYAVGSMADYRAEIRIALERSFAILGAKEDLIFTHSPIDSLVWSTLNVDRIADLESVSDEAKERSLTVMFLASFLLQDSMKYDHIFFVDPEGQDDDQTQFTDLLLLSLDALDASYTILEGDSGQWPTQCATIVQAYLEERG